MARKEFTKKTQREAFTRSGFKCEAIGAMYGLPSGQRCNADLALGVQFDHIVLDANSKDNSLENCAAVCIKCHKWKTANHDIPMAAKTVRQQDKSRGIKKAVAPIKSPAFATSEKTATRDPNKGLPPLPRNSFYEAKPCR